MAAEFSSIPPIVRLWPDALAVNVPSALNVATRSNVPSPSATPDAVSAELMLPLMSLMEPLMSLMSSVVLFGAA